MGRHKQHSLQLYNLKLSIGLECMTICIPLIDWWWVQALLCTRHILKEETGHTKGGQEGSTGKMRRAPLGVSD